MFDQNKTTKVYDAYWEFAVKRQDVFFNRMKGVAYPWTDDEIINKYKFTNVYRATDRVSQYLIKNVIYTNKSFSPEDQCFRILFFKLFNNIETWEYIENELGEISYKTYNFDEYDKLLMKRMNDGQRIYSAAYIMPSGKSVFLSSKKHQNNLRLLEYMMESNLPLKIARTKSLKELYEVLLEYPTLGSFLSFQFAIDINYSELCDFSEMSFVVAGPGAKSGIKKCFPNFTSDNYSDVIRYMAENQEEEFEKRGLSFKTLFGRRLQLVDCQNIFCEVDKYARIKYPQIKGLNNRTRIKQQYHNRGLGEIQYFFPPKWGIKNGDSF